MATSLPTPRALLTSLLTTLTTSSTSLPPGLPNDPPSNPLKHISSSQKAALTTLHVLFPPPMLLQALDLLDRGLVTRLVLSSPSNQNQHQDQAQDEGLSVMPPQANTHLGLRDEDSGAKGPGWEIGKARERESTYLVQSSQPPKSRFVSQGGAGTAAYIVHPTAWNCSCAAFAFSAFPSTTPTTLPPWDLDDADGDPVAGEDEGEVGEWEFGGRSFDGKGNDEEGVAVCKHILAVVLGDRWDVLGSFVRERVVGREEMAGICGD